jgi:hypothetical protein
MMRSFLTIRHPVLLASRAFASRGSNRLHQTAVSHDNAPSSAHAGSTKNKPKTEIDHTVDESARTLQQNVAKGKTQMDKKDAKISASNFPERDAEISLLQAKVSRMDDNNSRLQAKVSRMDAKISLLQKDVQHMSGTLQRPIYSYILFRASWKVIRDRIPLNPWPEPKHGNKEAERKELLQKCQKVWDESHYKSKTEMRQMINKVSYLNCSCGGAANHLLSILKSPVGATARHTRQLLMICSTSSRSNGLLNSSLSCRSPFGTRVGFRWRNGRVGRMKE